jgi:hypothetical protein
MLVKAADLNVPEFSGYLEGTRRILGAGVGEVATSREGRSKVTRSRSRSIRDSARFATCKYCGYCVTFINILRFGSQERTSELANKCA